MMIKRYVMLLLMSFVYFGNAQNLVLNGSFEDYNSIPESLGDTWRIKHWEKSSKSSDYYHKQALLAGDTIPAVPLNYNGFQYPRTGDAYAGMLVYNKEYIQTKLAGSLKKSQLYFVRYYVNLSDSAAYACRVMNAFFTEKATSSNNPLIKLAKGKPSVENYSSNLLDDTLSWMPIAGFYRAKGNERFLTITGFNSPWNDGCVKRLFRNHVYYYIDDVSLHKLQNISFENIEGNTLDLEEIIFDNDKSVIKSEYFDILEQLVKLLQANSFLNIAIWGYTSEAGTKERNAILAKKRAEAIKTYLLSKGIKPERIIKCAKGSKDLNRKTIEIEFL